MRKWMLPALAAAIVLSPATGFSHQLGAGPLVEQKAAVINALHRTASKALINAAQYCAFPDYFHARDDVHRRAAKGRIAKVARDGIRFDAAYARLERWTLVAFSKVSP